MNQYKDKWLLVLEAIRSRLSQSDFDTWIKPIVFVGFENDKIQLQVPNKFFYEYLAHNYGTMLMSEFAKFNLSEPYIRIKEDAAPAEKAVTRQTEAPLKAKPVFDTHLAHEYTFDNYVKGEANKLARSIALTIATKPMQTAFNPFFIYGDSGVGKSHLVNAIGLKLLETHPDKRVLYISAHDFLMQYTDSVPKNKFNDFMYFYQSIDCLIIDDIHEISGKPKTQEALFNIFNHLQRNRRQIIFTSDKAPSKLDGFEERMSSRFVMGATAEIHRPDEQLRRAILKAKIAKNQLSIPKDVIDYVATNITGNVRDLEGVLNTMLLQSITSDTEISLEMAQRIVSKLVRFKAKTITMELILHTVCKFYKVTQRDINSASRKGNVVNARQIAMYLAQKHTNMSSTQIGMHIGRRDHSTVLYACNKVDMKIKKSSAFKEELHAIEQEMVK